MDGEGAVVLARTGRAAALLIPLFLLLAIGLAACGGGGGSDGGNGRDANGAVRAVSEGELLYEKRCMACHGGDLEGGFGPELRNVGERMSREEIVSAIRDGIGIMPALGDRLTEEEIAAIADWIAGLSTGP